MQFIPKLLLTTLICTTGAQLTHCSQAQSSSAITTQAATTVLAEQKQAVAQAVMQATAQSAPQATGHEIVERDAKRVKLSAAKEKQEAEKQEKNWVLSYAQKLSPEAEKKLEAAKIALTNEAIVRDRATILPAMLYDLLECMPRELTNMIAEYDKPYTRKEKFDHTFKIALPQNTTITRAISLLLPHGNIVVVVFSNGYLQIFKEQADKQAKESWELKQTLQAHTHAVTAIVDLKDQRFATGSDAGNLKIWEHDHKQQHILKKTIATATKIKKLALLPNGNIVVSGEELITPQDTDLPGTFSVWNPATGQYIYKNNTSWESVNELGILSDGTIVILEDSENHAAYSISSYDPVTGDELYYSCLKYVPSTTKHLCVLPNNDITAIVYDSTDNDYIQIILLEAMTGYKQIKVLADYGFEGVKDGLIIASQDGKVIYSPRDNEAGTWNMELDTHDRREIGGFQHFLQFLIELSDGRLLGIVEDGTIEIIK